MAPVAAQFEEYNNSQDKLLDAVLARRHTLSDDRRYQLNHWVLRLNASESLLVQIGAHDHSRAGPGRTCVQRGWRSILFEPKPDRFLRLRMRYTNLGKQVDQLSQNMEITIAYHQ